MDDERSTERNVGHPPGSEGGRPEGAIGRLAARQHGVVSTVQLRALGLDRFAVRRRVVAGYLQPVQPHVFAVGHGLLTTPGRYLAAVLSCGPAAILSHQAAAEHWGIRAGTVAASVTVPHGHFMTRPFAVHQSRLQPAHGTAHDGVPVTTVARTLLDLAGTVSARALARAVDSAERLDRFDLAAVEEALARARGRRGARALRRTIAAWRPRQTRSELEDRFAELTEAAGLSRPRLNVLLAGELTRHEVDALWPGQRLVVQLDGFAHHRTRRDRERDAVADADLELAGYRVVRLTWGDVTARPNATARRLRRLTAAGK